MHALQIDCVTVKGSTQPMGLFTYDITLEHVAEPDPIADGSVSLSGGNGEGDNGAATPDAMVVAANGDMETFSHSGYDHEFEEHPDLVKCGASCGFVMKLSLGAMKNNVMSRHARSILVLNAAGQLNSIWTSYVNGHSRAAGCRLLDTCSIGGVSRTWAATEAFLERFREGFRAYQSGNWPAARTVLEECCLVRDLTCPKLSKHTTTTSLTLRFGTELKASTVYRSLWS